MSDFFFFMPKKFVSLVQEQKILDEEEADGRLEIIARHYVEGPDAYSDLDEEVLLALFDEEDEPEDNGRWHISSADEKPCFIEKLMVQMGREDYAQGLRNSLFGNKLKNVNKRRIL